MELVLVINAESHTRRLVRDNLEQAEYRVLTVPDGETGLKMLHRETPDLVVLDSNLPQANGWEVARSIRLDHDVGSLPILMLTSQTNPHVKSQSLELGIDYYVTRPINARELVQRVRALLRRTKAAEQPAHISRGDLTIDVGEQQLLVCQVPVELTPTEFALLCMFMEKPGHIFTRRELLQASLGYSDEGASRTLDTHIRNLRQKIEPNPHRPTYIQTVHRVGYRFAWLGGEIS
ncbi:MAG: response regulator transcription factor [Anaerolineales bacterium]|nr:response regulator transcription factor [Anaerolineales bacterium]